MPFIVQEAAKGRNEYEIYYLRSPERQDKPAFLSITQVNNFCRKAYPINSIHNPCTGYKDITDTFPAEDLDRIWQAVKNIGSFPVARVGVKADDRASLTRQSFKVVEINLFLPMPLILFAKNVGWDEKMKIIKKTMTFAARLAKRVPKTVSGRQIFFRKLQAHHEVVK